MSALAKSLILNYRRHLSVAASILAVLGSAGCGSTKQSSPQVATLSTPTSHHASATTATSAPTSAAPVRLRLKLNGTTADDNVAFAPYFACLRQHGIVNATSEQNVKIAIGSAPPNLGAAAMKACAGLLPLPPIENDPANPHAIDFNRAVVACLRSKGVRYVEVTTQDGRVGISSGGPDNDQQSISLTGQYLTACEEQVSRTGH